MFKGEAEIQIRDKNTLEVKKTIKKKNSMTLMALHNLFINEDDIGWTRSSSSTAFGDGSSAMIGHHVRLGGIDSSFSEGFLCVGLVDPNTAINQAAYRFTTIDKTGDYVRSQVIPGEVQPLGFIDLSTKTAELTFKGRVEPPSSGTREINSVQLGYVGPSRKDNRNQPGFAVVLDDPCSQTDEEILDVFYRVSVVGNDRDPEDILWKTFFLSRLFPFYYDSFVDGTLFGDNNTSRHYDVTSSRFFGYKLAPARKVIRNRVDGITTDSITTSDKNFSQLTGRYSYSYGRDDDIGNTYSSVYAFTNPSPFGDYLSLQNANTVTRSHSQQLFPPDINPVQSVFKHSPLAIRPYLDPSFLGASTANVIINGDNFELDSSNVYKIIYTTGGDINSAEYTLEKKMTLGYKIGDGEYEGEAGSSKPIMTLPGHEVTGDDPSTYQERSTVAQPGDGIVASDNDLLHYKRGMNEWIIFPSYQKYDNDHLICADAYGMNILNVYTDDYVNYDEWSTPPLNVTGLTDYCVDNNKIIWAASKNEGLYKIDHENSTVEKIDPAITGVNSDICYSVDFKNNGDIWAVFFGGLLRSQDGGTTWEEFNEATDPQFSIPNVTDGNWNKILGIVIDKDSADDRILLVFNNSGSENICWWSRAGSSPSSDFSDSGVLVDYNTSQRLGYIRNYDTGFAVRKWIKHFPQTSTFLLLNNYRYSTSSTYRDGQYSFWKTIDFGATSTRATLDSPTNLYFTYIKPKYLNFEKDSNGIMRLEHLSGIYINTSTQDVKVELLDNDLTNVENITEYTVNSGTGILGLPRTSVTNYNMFYVESMGKGIGVLAQLGLIYLNHYIANSAPDGGTANHIIWDKYGWNGVEWEKDFQGSKPVHETDEPLIDGLSISFEPGGTPQFVQDEYTTAYVFRGVHKDNATSLTFNSAYHLRPTQNLTDLTPSAIPDAARGLVQNKKLEFNTHNVSSSDLARELYQVSGMVGCGTASTSITRIVHSEIKFEGDFSVSFKTSKTGRASDSSIATFSITPVSTLSTVAEWLDPQYVWWFSRFENRGYTGNTLTGTPNVVVPADSTWTGQEVFTLERVGTDIFYKIDGTVVHTETNASTDPMVAVVAFRYEDFRTFFDMNVDYFTENRRIIELGDDIQETGVFDPGFAMVEAWLEPRTCKVKIDGVDAPLIVDTLQDPDAGQAVLLPKTGWLVLNDLDENLNVEAEYQAMFSIISE